MKNQDDKSKSNDDATTAEDQEVGEENESESNADELSPYEKKIGERPDNLRRRSEWFQKRTGGR